MQWWIRIVARFLPKPRPVEYRIMDNPDEIVRIVEAVLARFEAEKQQAELRQPR